MSMLDGQKDLLAGINRKVAALDAAIADARKGVVPDFTGSPKRVPGLVDLDRVRALQGERETLWREMQGLVSSAIGA